MPKRLRFSTVKGARDHRPEAVATTFRSAVSLHAHTHHSREAMADLPRYIARIPLVAIQFERHVRSYARREGRPLDFARGWWHPPVGPQEVFESESAQIASRFHLSSLVSVTDHDDITAGLELQTLFASRRAPIAFEWTVPFDAGYFHLGVHNLPPDGAHEWYRRLNAFTSRTSSERLPDLLEDLHETKDVLVVLCHPLWDLAGVGAGRHAAALRELVSRHRHRLHGIEVNGYRSHRENAGAKALAADAGLPPISGGDRHGRAPNAVLNLTAARTFADFVGEIRDGLSHVVIMPEYRRNLVARKLAAASDVLRTDRVFPEGEVRWTDRVMWEGDGRRRSLSSHWPNGGPLWVRSSVRAFKLIANPVVLPVLGAALDTMERVTDEPAAHRALL